MKKEISKADLMESDVVYHHDGTSGEWGNYSSCMYLDNLKNKHDSDYDIIKVDRTTTETIFERIEHIEFIRGDIYSFEIDGELWIVRCGEKGKEKMNHVSGMTPIDSFFMFYGGFRNDRGLDYKFATPKQKSTLIKAEIENGYLWDDKAKELIKID